MSPVKPAALVLLALSIGLAGCAAPDKGSADVERETSNVSVSDAPPEAIHPYLMPLLCPMLVGFPRGQAVA